VFVKDLLRVGKAGLVIDASAFLDELERSGIIEAVSRATVADARITDFSLLVARAAFA